jgi:hypothetical protein
MTDTRQLLLAQLVDEETEIGAFPAPRRSPQDGDGRPARCDALEKTIMKVEVGDGVDIRHEEILGYRSWPFLGNDLNQMGMSDFAVRFRLLSFGSPPPHLLSKKQPSIGRRIRGNNRSLEPLFQTLDVGYLGMSELKCLEEGARFLRASKLLFYRRPPRR